MLNTYHAHQIQWLIESRGWNISIWGMRDKPFKLVGKKLSFNLKEMSLFFFSLVTLYLGCQPPWPPGLAARKLQHSSRNSLGGWEEKYNCIDLSPEYDRSSYSTCPCKTHWWTRSLVPPKQHDPLVLDTACIPWTFLWTHKPTTNIVTEI